MKLRFLVLAAVVAFVLATAPVPDQVQHAREEIERAHAGIKRAEEILAGDQPGILDRAKEKVKDMFSTTAPSPQPEDKSILEKLRNYFRPEEKVVPETPETILGKIRAMFSPSESVTEQAKHAASEAGQKASESAESILDRLRHIFRESTTAAEEATPAAQVAGKKVGEATQSIADKVRAALGYGKAAVDSAVETAAPDTTMDKIKRLLGMETPSTMDKAKATISDKIKDTLGMHEPTLGEKIKDTLGMHEPTIGEKIKSAMGMGTAEPTLGEKIKSTLGVGQEPEATLGEKIKSGVKSAMGIDTTGVAEKLGVATHKPTVLERLRSYFGVHQPTTAEKMKQQLDESITQARTLIEDKIEALRRATGIQRQSAYQDLVNTLNKARADLTARSDTIFEAMSHPIDTMKHAAQGVAEKVTGSETAEDTRGLLTRAKDDMNARIQSLYDTIASTSRSWRDDLESFVKGAFGMANTYLLQGSQYEDGVTSFYVNDNGHEYLDITGQNIDASKFDKLKALNHFRTQYNLPVYQTWPSNVTVQTHPLKRTHVLIKSSRAIDGNRFDYVFDDGEEYLDVYWAGEQPKMFTKEMQTRIIDSFRQTHGLIPSPATVPKVRATIAHKTEKKDEL